MEKWHFHASSTVTSVFIGRFFDQTAHFQCFSFRSVGHVLQLLGNVAKFVIPGLTETADEGFAEELIDGELEFAAFLDGRTTDIPTMILQTDESVGEFAFTDGIERTGDGLAPMGASFAEGFICGAEAAAVGTIAGEDTVLAIDNTGDEVAFAVGVGNALGVDQTLGLGAEVWPDIVEYGLEMSHFVHGQWGTAVAFHAALPFAGFEIAAEAFGENFGGEDDISYFYDWGIMIHEEYGERYKWDDGWVRLRTYVLSFSYPHQLIQRDGKEARSTWRNMAFA